MRNSEPSQNNRRSDGKPQISATVSRSEANIQFGESSRVLEQLPVTIELHVMRMTIAMTVSQLTLFSRSSKSATVASKATILCNYHLQEGHPINAIT